MKILAIETSCDDTCVAILEVKELKNSTSFEILSNVVQTQTIHNQYGGVFPAMAKREHVKNIGPVYEKAMRDAKNPKIDAIAVTVGPGLEPALWVGIVFAKELSAKLPARNAGAGGGVPVIPVNHMEGHVLSVLVQKDKTFSYKKDTLQFPVLSLLVSGGHTEIVLSKKFGQYKIIGQTRDDAAGEAFDKVARMLGLPYPGGPEISKIAESVRSRRPTSGDLDVGRLERIKLPRPMIHSKDYDFSFSGLKTAVLYLLRDLGKINDKVKAEIAKEFEDAAVEVLVAKTLSAVKEFKIKTLIVGGGVSANKHLQVTLKKAIKKQAQSTALHFPTKSLSTDNALMIAIAGYFQYQKKKGLKNRGKLTAQGNLAL